MNASNRARVDVQLAASGRDIPDTGFIRQWVQMALDGAGVAGPMDVSVRVVDVEEMRSLNRRYRGRDRPTNVLSFPGGPVAGLPVDEPGVLGDIVVCAAVVAEEAERQRKSVDAHWAHMIVHGTLHLLGYDHEHDADAREMEALEARVLQAAGISDPYRSPR